MTAIVILGMHRSGTSATTRALGLLGASLGPPANLGKFWENQVMRRPNERLLEAFGGGWECPPELPDGWVGAPEAKALVPEAKVALAEYGSAPVFVWKDPRTCMTLPFWMELLDEPPVVVFIHRHPAEVAASLRTRNSLTTAHGYALWERFNCDALRNSVGLRTVALEYRTLVEEPAATMQHIVDALAGWGVALPRDPATTDLELTAKRRHHEADAGVFDDPLSTESQRALYALLPSYSGVHDSFALERPLPDPSPISVELIGICAQLRQARRETRQANTELRRLSGSRKRLLRRLLQASLPGGSAELDAGGVRAVVVGVSPDPKVVITGTGRAGTTLLVQVLTDLGLDTGFAPDAPIDEGVNAGLETGIEAPDAPRIVKNPNLSRRLGPLLDDGKVVIEHVIIPVRDLDVAAASRVRNTGYGADLHTFGGLFGTARATRQRDALAVVFYELMYTVARHDLPHTLLLFPRFAEDWEYLHRQLSFLAPGIPADRWREALARRSKPGLIHEVPLDPSERAKTYAGTFYNRAIARPLRGARRLIAGEHD